MFFRALVITVFILVSVSLLVSYGATNAGTAPSNYGFDVSIYPDSAKEGVFQAKLIISQLATGKIIAAPTVRFQTGQAAETNSEQSQDGVNFKFVVSVDEKGTVAEYSAVVLHSTTEVARSQAKVSLTN